MKIKKIILLQLLLLISAGIYGQYVNYNAMLFTTGLNVEPGARPAGMGGAFLAVSDDLNAVAWNPAGMAQVKSVRMGLSHERWFLDSYLQHFSVLLPYGKSAYGLDIFYNDSGNFLGRDDAGVLTGETLQAFDFGGNISMGFEVWHGTNFGFSFKYVNQNIAGAAYSALLADLCLLMNSSDNMSIAITMKNVGWSSRNVAPITFGGGAAVKMFPSGGHSVLLTLDNEIMVSGLYTIRAGAEYTYDSLYSIRAGYRYFTEQNSLEGVNGLSLGAGVRISGVNIDYALGFKGDLGLAHRISLIYDFGKTDEPAAKRGYASGSSGLNTEMPPGMDLYYLGAAYEQAGESVMAAKKYYDCLQLDQKNAQAWKNLGLIYYKAGEKEKGYACLKKYINLRPEDVAIAEWLMKYEKYNKKP